MALLKKTIDSGTVLLAIMTIGLAVGCGSNTVVPGNVYYVSPDGADDNPGTIDQPFATLAMAGSVLQPGDTCYLREGVYRDVLRPARSGTADQPITISGYDDETAVISAADPITGWEAEEGGVCSAPMGWTLEAGDQIFSGEEMLCEARWPNAGTNLLFQPQRASASGGSPRTLVCESIPGGDDAWTGAKLWCAGGAAWICWTATITDYDAESHTLSFDTERSGWYVPRRGSRFVLRGLRRCLDAPGEWFYDSATQRLLLIPPEGATMDALDIQAKRRTDAVDLSRLSYITLTGLHLFAGGVRMDDASSHNTLENITARFVAHSWSQDVSRNTGILIRGDNHLLLNCDLGYSSASVLSVTGSDNRVINCLIQHGGYAGLWRGTVTLAGRRIVFSHNTVRHAGRDLINTHGLMESLIQYNDVSEAGWLTSDLGMFYGHNTDFANTEFRYNWVHDSHAEQHSMGIYFDHLSHNAIVHHNVVWNVGRDPIRFNNPSYCDLVFNNTCWRTGPVTTFDHSHRNDLFACRYTNNIFNAQPRLPDHVVWANNMIDPAPPYRDPAGKDFRPPEGIRWDVGAYEPDQPRWTAGHDFDNPPAPLPVYQAPRIAWMNVVRNACFEFGSLEGWAMTDGQNAQLVEGNDWGNNYGRGPMQPTGTSKFELKLGPARGGVSQTISGLSPNTSYTLSAWVRVSDAAETVEVGVTGHGGQEMAVSTSSTQWTRLSVDFTTGLESDTATIYVLKASDGPGNAWADNVTLPLTSDSDPQTLP
jgi:hypothetical protein